MRCVWRRVWIERFDLDYEDVGRSITCGADDLDLHSVHSGVRNWKCNSTPLVHLSFSLKLKMSTNHRSNFTNRYIKYNFFNNSAGRRGWRLCEIVVLFSGR